jgi:hypothetical protein
MASEFLKVQRHVVEENYSYMGGIARYLFEEGIAKKKVQNAVMEINPQAIANLVAS